MANQSRESVLSTDCFYNPLGSLFCVQPFSFTARVMVRPVVVVVPVWASFSLTGFNAADTQPGTSH